MKFTLSWLQEHLDTKADIKLIKNTLTNIGLEVESIQDRSQELKLFTVAKVIKASKHPDADKLKICHVETNKGNFQVVVLKYQSTYFPYYFYADCKFY